MLGPEGSVVSQACKSVVLTPLRGLAAINVSVKTCLITSTIIA